MGLIAESKRLIRTHGLDRFGTAYLLESPLPGPEPLRILAINLPLPYLQDVFDGPLTQVGRRPCLIGDLRRLARRLAPRADVCLARVPARRARRLPAGAGVLRGGIRIRQGVDIPDDWEALRRTFHATKRRLAAAYARGAPPAHEVSQDERDLAFFYRQMYLPHMRRRFGRFARLDSYASMADAFRRGFLVKVPAGPEPVAAALCEIRGRTYIYRRIGVRETETDPVRGGATSALYYLMLRQAWERRVSHLDMLRARAFLRDGVYLFKRQWGARVMPDDGGSTDALFCVPAGPPRKVATFFERCPLIVGSPSGLVAAVGVTGAGLDAASLASRYGSPGLAGLLVFGPDVPEPVAVPLSTMPPAPTPAAAAAPSA